MDARVFIKELKNMFIDVNKQEHRYTKVWLSEPEFAHYLKSMMYVLNVKTTNTNAVYLEINYIFNLLKNKLKLTNNEYLFNVDIYSNNESTPLNSSDIVLLDEA